MQVLVVYIVSGGVVFDNESGWVELVSEVDLSRVNEQSSPLFYFSGCMWAGLQGWREGEVGGGPLKF